MKSKRRLMACAMACGLCAGAVRAETYYVSKTGAYIYPYTNWATAARDNIFEALDVATDGDTVLVGEGAYQLPATLQVTKGVALRSASGAGVTTLHGRNAVRCLAVSNANAVVEGFTITGGYTPDDGAGVRLDAGTVSKCIIVSNLAASYYASGGASHYAVGGGASVRTNGVLANCIVAHNRINDDEIIPAYGGGVFLFPGGQVRNCTIVSNAAVGGDVYGAGVFFTDGSRAENSILYFNSKGTTVNNYDYSGSITHTLSNCCLQVPFLPGVPGSGNFTNDPQFASAVTDLRLKGTSPCVDAGLNQAWMTGATDMEGHPRIFGERVDVGADEAAFKGLGFMITADGVWSTWDVVPGAPRQFEWNTNLAASAWVAYGGVVTDTATRIMILDFKPPQRDKVYRYRWIRP